MDIDYTLLTPEILNSIVESFVQREGTDYGEDVSQAEKVAQVKLQLVNKTAFLVFDAETESINIMSQQQRLALSDHPMHDKIVTDFDTEHKSTKHL